MANAASLNNEIRIMLMDCGLFSQLHPDDCGVAAGYFSIVSMAQGTRVFEEGDAGTFMCIIHYGNVSVAKTDAEGNQVEIALLRKGRSFGEMAVLDGERRSATCTAATDCQLLSLGKDSLEKMMNEAPKVAAKVIRALAVALSKRLRMADGQRLS
ncbi:MULTISPECIES: Crp/Fnr family transcriptional regulator [Pseudomonas]|uniref:Cyclic nucleotide-binding domain-containing protein n=1 Tax=Pseudomonas quercus TaxID=2722792 RepID=A0ABX0YIQ6_9PSED|nr:MULTISPECIES: cyclic nucleotide-binding domain-containing protein [Pseudomonas]MBF7143563.1 cyclic nucleotide-binding domain-containing protein [Pseudomonas sp. LY10J]NJP02229.1 cyclic nucleotide-binding domain-containing protein [Pseudomonas quercus]